jgi:hypothetical protein
MNMANFDRKTETREVKKFMAREYPGSNPRVSHGKGTAWGWLKISFSIPRPTNCYCNDPAWAKVREEDQTISCRNCGMESSRVYVEVGKKICEFTGRTGDYGGRVNYSIGWL